MRERIPRTSLKLDNGLDDSFMNKLSHKNHLLSTLGDDICAIIKLFKTLTEEPNDKLQTGIDRIIIPCMK